MRGLRPQRHRVPAKDQEIDRALDAMSAPELRAAVLQEFDEDVRASVVDALIARATKATSGWRPTRPSQRIVEEAGSFAEAARHVGHADPDDTEHLRRATKAFLAGDHASTRAVFQASTGAATRSERSWRERLRVWGCWCQSELGVTRDSVGSCDALENRKDAQRAPSARPRFSMPFRECAQSPWLLIVKSGDFPFEFDDGDGLKDRRLAVCKMSISQVLISRTLSVCGEVAEWPKAAVC